MLSLYAWLGSASGGFASFRVMSSYRFHAFCPLSTRYVYSPILPLGYLTLITLPAHLPTVLASLVMPFYCTYLLDQSIQPWPIISTMILHNLKLSI